MKTDTEERAKDGPSAKDAEVEDEFSFFNKVRSDVLRKKLESMLKKDGMVKNLVSELKLPREIVTHLMSQIDDTKQAALGVISREVRLFFENTNLSDEMVKLLSQLSFEVSTRVRFVRNEPEGEAPRKKRRISNSIKLRRDRDTEEEAPSETEESTDTPTQ